MADSVVAEAAERSRFRKTTDVAVAEAVAEAAAEGAEVPVAVDAAEAADASLAHASDAEKSDTERASAVLQRQ